MNKIIRKIASLPISLQNIINNYISDISPKFKYEIYQERNKLVSLLTLVNYSTIPNISLKNELKLKLNYSIYKMLPSHKYKTMMLPWRNTKEQRELMIHEKCGNFQFIPSK